MQPDARTAVWETCRPQLIAYAARMVVQRSIAEELTQEAAVRLLGAGAAVEGDARVRAWLFKVVTHLALDHVKRHSTWRELSISGVRATAESNAAFVARRSACDAAGLPQFLPSCRTPNRVSTLSPIPGNRAVIAAEKIVGPAPFVPLARPNIMGLSE